MVLIRDEGSLYDAPLDAVWRYLGSEEHALAHPRTRNWKAEPVGDRRPVLSRARARPWLGPGGGSALLVPALGLSNEVLEGPLARSKEFVLYTPRGDKTQVDVVGEYTSREIPASRLERMVRELSDEAYAEDAPRIRAFARKK